MKKSTGVTLWSRNGDQGDAWRHAHVSVPPQTLSNFTINFVAIHGKGFRGDIAIDDLVLTPGMPLFLFIKCQSHSTETLSSLY